MKQDLEWRSEWDMKIPDLDNQHHELFEQLNRISAQVCELNIQTHSSNPCQELMESFLDKIREHFQTEEKLMNEIGYPDIAEHQREHAMFLAELHQGLREVSLGLESCDTIIHDIRDWYVSHVAMDGKEFANYFHNNTEAEAPINVTSSAGRR